MKPTVTTEPVSLRPVSTSRRRYLAAWGFALGLSSVWPVPVAAEEWRLFAQMQEGHGAIDLASIERSENAFFVDYRLMLANATDARFGQGSVSELWKKLALTCGQSQVAVIEVREMDSEGTIVGRASVPREQWKFFAPVAGSMEWKIRQLVCRTYADRARKIDAPPGGERSTAASNSTGELVLRPAKMIEAKLPVD
ncbi:MAG: hypothetical protein ACM3SV_10865 [Betaproteobacteria bacterium]